MTTKKLSVEIHESKRFDAKTAAELFHPSDVVRTEGSKETTQRSALSQKALDAKAFFNVYDGEVTVAEATDFTSIENVTELANRVQADLYADYAGADALERHLAKMKHQVDSNDPNFTDPLVCLADVLNNGGLRLAYGDAIKKQFKIAGTGGKDAKIKAMEWALEPGSLSPEQIAEYKATSKELRANFVLTLWIAAGRP